MEEELAQAFTTKDPEPLHRILDDEFIHTNAIGRVKTKQQTISKFHEQLSEMSFFSVSNGDVHIRMYGDAAVVTGTQVQHATKNDQLIYVKLRYTSMYAKREGEWKLVAGHNSEGHHDGTA